MERENELGITDKNFTTEYRMYDDRLGRWWSLDPLSKKFHYLSPYQYGSNNPIYHIDIDGLEGIRPSPSTTRTFLTNRRTFQNYGVLNAGGNGATSIKQTITNYTYSFSQTQVNSPLIYEGKAEGGFPQQTSQYQSSKSSIPFNVLLLNNQFKEDSETFELQVTKVTTVEKGENGSSKSEYFMFDGKDALALSIAENDYQQKLNNIVEKKLEGLNPKEKDLARGMTKIMTIGEIGPSPQQQVESQFQNMVKQGKVIASETHTVNIPTISPATTNGPD